METIYEKNLIQRSDDKSKINDLRLSQKDMNFLNDDIFEEKSDDSNNISFLI
jgi:hypothetical protein